MPTENIVLANPNRTAVFKGEYALIELNLAAAGEDIAIAELPGDTSLVVGATNGAELRWAGPTTLIYRAPDLPYNKGDFFVLAKGNGVYKHFIVIDHVASRSTPAEQALLRARFEAALPTVLIHGKGIESLAPAADPRAAKVDQLWPGLLDALAAAHKPAR